MLAVCAAPSAGGGPDSRRGLGGGASFFPSGGIEPMFVDGAGSLPGSKMGGGIDDERIRGRLGVPGGGRLGVPTGSTGTLGIFGGAGAGAGMLSGTEAALSAFTSASSVVESRVSRSCWSEERLAETHGTGWANHGESGLEKEHDGRTEMENADFFALLHGQGWVHDVEARRHVRLRELRSR